jgi:hypothetical protein
MSDIVQPEIVETTHVVLTREIEMERLFAGYDAALQGRELPRDLAVGDEGEVVGVENVPEHRFIVEFKHKGAPFWRGGLRPDEVRKAG